MKKTRAVRRKVGASSKRHRDPRLCAICLVNPSYVQDRDEYLGMPRSRLCAGCVRGLREFHDDEARLVKAAAYLRAWAAAHAKEGRRVRIDIMGDDDRLRTFHLTDNVVRGRHSRADIRLLQRHMGALGPGGAKGVPTQ